MNINKKFDDLFSTKVKNQVVEAEDVKKKKIDNNANAVPTTKPKIASNNNYIHLSSQAETQTNRLINLNIANQVSLPSNSTNSAVSTMYPNLHPVKIELANSKPITIFPPNLPPRPEKAAATPYDSINQLLINSTTTANANANKNGNNNEPIKIQHPRMLLKKVNPLNYPMMKIDDQTRKAQIDNKTQTKPSLEQEKSSDFTSFYKQLADQTSSLSKILGNLNFKMGEIENKVKKSDDEPISKNKTTANKTTNSLVKHTNFICDNCDKDIVGIRWKCSCISCDDYDLCEKCEQINGVHINGHNFIKIKTPISILTESSYISNALHSKLLSSNGSYANAKIKLITSKSKEDSNNQSPESVKKRKRKSTENATSSGGNQAQQQAKTDKKSVVVEKKQMAISDEEKIFNRIKELHDNLLIEIEPSIKKRTAYYIESFKRLSNHLLANSNNQQQEKEAKIEKLNEDLFKLDLLDKSGDEIIMKRLGDYQMKSNEYKTRLFMPKRFLSKHRIMLEKYKRIEKNYDDEIKDENKLEEEKNRDEVQMYRSKINNNSIEQVRVFNNVEPNEQEQKSKKKLDYIFTVSPYFSTNYHIQYNKYLNVIYRSLELLNKDEIIKNYRANFMQNIDEQSKDKEFFSTIIDEVKCNQLVQAMALKAFERAKQTSNLHKPNDLPFNFDILFSADKRYVTSPIFQLVNPKANSQGIFSINELQTKQTENETVSKDDESNVEQLKSDNVIEQIKVDEIKLQDEFKETNESEIKEEEKNDEQLLNEEIEKLRLKKEELLNCIDILSCSTNSKSVVEGKQSISIEKLDKDECLELEKREDVFFNITLDKSVSSRCSTPSTSSICSLESYELVMSDSFDFEKNNIEIESSINSKVDDAITTESKENDNQSLIALKSSTTATVAADNQLMNSSRLSVYKSLIESTTSELEQQQQTSLIADQLNRNDVFDFNNWTYLLEKPNDSQTSSSKDSNKLMNEFYEICKSKYGLK